MIRGHVSRRIRGHILGYAFWPQLIAERFEGPLQIIRARVVKLDFFNGGERGISMVDIAMNVAYCCVPCYFNGLHG